MKQTYTVTRRIEFDAGHRVYGHESKCAHIHGHRYVVLVTCAPIDDLDSIGRVVDFSVIKGKVGTWIDENLDHGMILCEGDPLVAIWNGGFKFVGRGPEEHHKHFIMKDNPTAENIARMIYFRAEELLSDYYIKIVSVEVQETPNCKAVYER
jgi:6-pyruvoyltetrahydropterin/6-carboxytetrahydropterin synthase